MNLLAERIAEAERGGETLWYKVTAAYFPQRTLTVYVSKHGLLPPAASPPLDRNSIDRWGRKGLSLLDFVDEEALRYGPIDQGAILCRGVKRFSLQGRKDGATIRLLQNGSADLQIGDAISLAAESVEYQPDAPYEYIPNIEGGVNFSWETHYSAVETFFRSVEPARVQGEPVFYSSELNSYDQLVCRFRYGRRHWYGLFSSVRAMRLSGAAFEGLNLVGVERIGGDGEMEFRSNDGGFAVRSRLFCLHEGGNQPLPLAPLYVPPRPRKRTSLPDVLWTIFLLPFWTPPEKKGDLQGFVWRNFDKEFDVGQGNMLS